MHAQVKNTTGKSRASPPPCDCPSPSPGRSTALGCPVQSFGLKETRFPFSCGGFLRVKPSCAYAPHSPKHPPCHAPHPAAPWPSSFPLKGPGTAAMRGHALRKILASSHGVFLVVGTPQQRCIDLLKGDGRVPHNLLRTSQVLFADSQTSCGSH